MIAGFSAKARQTMNLESALGKITALLNGSPPGRFDENTQTVPKQGFTPGPDQDLQHHHSRSDPDQLCR